MSKVNELLDNTDEQTRAYMQTAKTMMAKNPEKALELAVKGMLPKNSLGRQMFKKLHVYAGPEHEQAAQKPEVYTFEG